MGFWISPTILTKFWFCWRTSLKTCQTPAQGKIFILKEIFHSQSKYCLLEVIWAIYKISSHHSFTHCVFHVSLLLNILGYITVIKSMREVQDYMDIATMKKSSNTWEMIFFQQMCILCLPNAKFYTLTEEGGVEERDTMVVLGDLIDWSTRKIWMLNNYL